MSRSWRSRRGVDFLRGEANRDLEVNITDPVFTLTYLFLGGAEPSCLDACDADDSGKIELTDAVFTLNFLFDGGAARPLPIPYPERGRDAMADDLPPCPWSHGADRAPMDRPSRQARFASRLLEISSFHFLASGPTYSVATTM